ncbi:YheC/YheD family protein [Effusibacillus dendaii]|uniref:YheC/YheD family protein n=1 Tax=Effusibacillus dendaii TaxID=2743772 RepID=UPI00384E4162
MKKHKCLIGSKQLAPHVPETRWMTRSNVWALIEKSGQVILKPLGGSRGVGVIQVSSIGNDDKDRQRPRKSTGLSQK